jgi:hypothetical protein
MKDKILTREEIIKTLQANKEYLKKYGVKRIGVFGSFVSGSEHEHSDIDLVIDFEMSLFDENFKGLFDAFMDLSTYLEKLFGKKIDILTRDGIRTIRIKRVADEIERNTVYV